MMLAHPLQLQQLQFFWEVFPQGLGVFLIHSKDVPLG